MLFFNQIFYLLLSAFVDVTFILFYFFFYHFASSRYKESKFLTNQEITHGRATRVLVQDSVFH